MAIIGIPVAFLLRIWVWLLAALGLGRFLAKGQDDGQPVVQPQPPQAPSPMLTPGGLLLLFPDTSGGQQQGQTDPTFWSSAYGTRMRRSAASMD